MYDDDPTTIQTHRKNNESECPMHIIVDFNFDFDLMAHIHTHSFESYWTVEGSDWTAIFIFFPATTVLTSSTQPSNIETHKLKYYTHKRAPRSIPHIHYMYTETHRKQSTPERKIKKK